LNLRFESFGSVAAYYNKHFELREKIIGQAPAADRAAWRASPILSRIEDVLFVYGFGNTSPFNQDLTRLVYDQPNFPAANVLSEELQRLHRNRIQYGREATEASPVANAARPYDDRDRDRDRDRDGDRDHGRDRGRDRSRDNYTSFKKSDRNWWDKKKSDGHGRDTTTKDYRYKAKYRSEEPDPDNSKKYYRKPWSSKRSVGKKKYYHKDHLHDMASDPKRSINRAYAIEVVNTFENTSPDGMIEIDEGVLYMTNEQYVLYLEASSDE
jgi:hypothetical protein